ncbi:MAG: Ppx/GppA phosphatase family protein [Myxococcota bacterium]
MPHITIDIGSNSAVILIAERDESGEWRSLYEKAETVRFGAEIDENGFLTKDVIAACASVIKEYKKAWESFGGGSVMAAATGVLRDAKNFSELKAALEAEAGVSPILLSADEEARILYLAVRHHCKEKAMGGVVAIDVGGYTTEVSWGKEEKPEYSQSYKLGCVELTQKYWLENRPSGKTLKDVRAEVSERWRQYLFPENLKDYEIIASGGTITTIAALLQELTVYDAEKVHGFVINKRDIEDLLNENLVINPAAERVMKGVMDIKRAEVILAGSLIFDEFMSLYNVSRLQVNERGLRWGLLHTI